LEFEHILIFSVLATLSLIRKIPLAIEEASCIGQAISICLTHKNLLPEMEHRNFLLDGLWYLHCTMKAKYGEERAPLSVFEVA